MTAGDGKAPVLPGFEVLQGTTRGGVLGMKDELERLAKERAQLAKQIETLNRNFIPLYHPKRQRRAQLAKQIETLDERIATLGRRVIEALSAP